MMSSRLEITDNIQDNGVNISTQHQQQHYQISEFDAHTEAVIQQQVDAVALTTQRQPKVYRQVFVSRPAGKVRTVVKRLATPPADIIEREIHIEEQPDHVLVQIEKPATPAPRVIERQIVHPALNKPIVHTQMINVPPRHSTSRITAETPAQLQVSLSQSSVFTNGPITAPLTGPLTPSMSQEMMRQENRFSSQSFSSRSVSRQHQQNQTYQNYF